MARKKATPKKGARFNLFLWRDTIPLCDDLWLGMQAQNIAMVDMMIIRDIEREAVQAFYERERTPTDILMPLSALSQMWMFSLYEFLRTWRQRAKGLLDLADKYSALITDEEREKFMGDALGKSKAKQTFVKVGLVFHNEHIAKIADAKFVSKLKDYYLSREELFRDVEAMRVTIAKHEIPRTAGFIAEAPGYGRMDTMTGSMYWQLTLKDNSLVFVNRRRLANAFFGLDEEE